MVVCYDYPFLAAPPDGLVKSDSVVEVKCPYKGRYDKIAAGDNFPFLTDDGQLKKTHNYYDQVQGQMYCTGRRNCYFVVYTFVDFRVTTVKLDKEYCAESLVPKLSLFYTKHYLPFLGKRL